MENYETALMTGDQLDTFIEYFEQHIGTDYEVNDDPDTSMYYVVCFELEPHEVDMLAEYEDAYLN